MLRLTRNLKLGLRIPLGKSTRLSRYDCVVVGAGPSGSSAAFTLAEKGFRVLMVDRCRFPRVKPCGDAVTTASVFALERIFHRPVVEKAEERHRINRVRVRGSGDTQVEVKVRPGYVVRRVIFDALLVELAQDAGATVLHDRVVKPLMEKGCVAGVRGAHADYRAPVVIGADGFPSSLAKRLGMGPLLGFELENLGAAIRTYSRSAEPLGDCLEILYVESIAPGYGWVFPVDERTANFGVGALVSDLRKKGMTLLGCLKRLASDAQCRSVMGAATERCEGRGLPLGPILASTVDDGVIFVGDAAGFVNPITGEGIHYALVSGHLAALTAGEALSKEDCSADSLRKYESRWKKEFGSDFFVGRALRQMLFNHVQEVDRLISWANTSRYWQGVLRGIMEHTIDYSSLRLSEVFMKHLPRGAWSSAGRRRPLLHA